MYSAKLLAEYQLNMSGGVFPFAEKIYNDLSCRTITPEKLKDYLEKNFPSSQNFLEDQIIRDALQYLEARGKLKRIFEGNELKYFQFL